MARLADWLNSAVSSKSELEKEMEGDGAPGRGEGGFSWGLLVLCVGALWAVIEFVCSILYFF